MQINKTILAVLLFFIIAGGCAAVLLPGEQKKNKAAAVRIGAGDDISGLLMDETVKAMEGKYQVSEELDSSYFADCCSNTAQWAMNAKEINVGFYCSHIAKYTVEHNKNVMIYGPVIMNGEIIVYRNNWEEVSSVGITQGREQWKAYAKNSYEQILEFHEITQKGILYALEDGQVDAAVLDITKAAQIPEHPSMPLSDTDYISYVLVADKEFVKTEAFYDFIDSYNKAANRLNDSGYLAESLQISENWLSDKTVKFLELESKQE